MSTEKTKTGARETNGFSRDENEARRFPWPSPAQFISFGMCVGVCMSSAVGVVSRHGKSVQREPSSLHTVVLVRNLMGVAVQIVDV